MGEVTILHLTDIHAGKGELVDEDNKAKIPNADRLKQLPRLGRFLAAMPRPDYVVVSGDITIQGDREGLDNFKDWLEQQIDKGVLPPPERFMIVPGNHDVKRQKRAGDPPQARLESFAEVYGNVFPHAHLPGHDPDPSFPDEASLAAGGLIGGFETREEFGKVKLVSSSPYLLDLDRDLLIFGFNSSHGCGVPLPADPKILQPLDAVAVGGASKAIKQEMAAVREAYLNSLIIDAGMITDDQIDYFNGLMTTLREALGEKYDRLTKIAVLHHHISHLWRQQLEAKSFEATVDAAQLKQALTEYGFDMVLHGHKHTNHVGLDGSLIPVDQAERFNPLCIVSGGTIAGHPRLNDEQSFKVITLSGQTGPRVRARIRQVPLKAAANPKSFIDQESRLFNVPVGSKLPELHDDKATKTRLDDDLLARLAPEWNASPGTRANAAVLASESDTFAPSMRYRCHSVIDTKGTKTFYEIIQATDEIGFSTVSRIRWLVSDAAALTRSGSPATVVLLIGDLEKTHYSEATSVDEVKASILQLEEMLAPAIAGGLVAIRTHAYAQDEIKALSLEVAQ
ncbi:metallophosphoesterase family protein [Caulobacter segnis]